MNPRRSEGRSGRTISGSSARNCRRRCPNWSRGCISLYPYQGGDRERRHPLGLPRVADPCFRAVMPHGGIAAINAEVGPGDKTGPWTAEEENRVSDLLGLTHAVQHVVSAEDWLPGRAVTAGHAFELSRPDCARAHAVHPDIITGEIQRLTPGEGQNRPFRRI